MHNARFGKCVEQILDRQKRYGANPCRGIREFLRLAQCDQVFERIHVDRWVNKKNGRAIAAVDDGCEFTNRVISRVAIQRRIHCERRARNEDGVTIGVGLRHRARADITASTGTIVDHHRLPPQFGQMFAIDAGSKVSATAGRERHQKADRLARIVFARRRR